ncbi:MAG: Uma2 family endonuclease [Eubacterium sp.]|nr:Uma2 family endonuclease [Eubacterium sp.]
MRTLEELRAKKKELGYTNAEIADRSGVPVPTVAKIFSGATRNPRRDTIDAIEKVLYAYVLKPGAPFAAEEAAVYTASADPNWKRGASERWPGQGGYTLEDYYAIPDDIRVELIDGVFYDMAAPTRTHQAILGQLFREFALCADMHNRECDVKCRVYFAPVDVRLFRDDRNMFEPDLVVLCHEDNNERMIDGAPELVLEVLSPSTRQRDCLLKLNKYMEAGVHEYWIVDPESRKVLVYDFTKDVLPEIYSFSDIVPIGLSGGECRIDFRSIVDVKRF